MLILIAGLFTFKSCLLAWRHKNDCKRAGRSSLKFTAPCLAELMIMWAASVGCLSYQGSHMQPLHSASEITKVQKTQNQPHQESESWQWTQNKGISLSTINESKGRWINNIITVVYKAWAHACPMLVPCVEFRSIRSVLCKHFSKTYQVVWLSCSLPSTADLFLSGLSASRYVIVQVWLSTNSHVGWLLSPPQWH